MVEKDLIGKLDRMNQTKEMDKTIRSLGQKKYSKMNLKYKTVKKNQSLKKKMLTIKENIK